ncbi:glycine betaine/L-proline ABC transporter substrate-binding protein ProX [Roseofilum reptotaenium]|uniref:glycine betaine/L-proline ABC transporter substrate-binding protein ProX n=1 Tax=Roseofilum reptotaenium TaxID=1233427 RepID=UPI00232ECA02|nr:glycine betaine/L-proline ABC transporter substrate-binding protein ProX [Roseofilum reptotaenium]
MGAVFLTLLLGIFACQPTTSNRSSGENNTEEISTDLPGKGITVKSVRTTTLENHFQVQIVNKALQQLGYETPPPAEIPYTSMFLAIANGDLDYTSHHWEKIQTEIYQNSGGDEKLSKLGVIVQDLLQGYQIDKKTAEEYNLSDIGQLKDPEIAKLFDTDGNGKANLIGCDSGWACELVIQHHLEVYGLTDTVEQDNGKYVALMADTITRYREGKPVLFYTWTPHSLGSILKPGEDVVWLEVPYTDLPESQGNVSEADTTVNGKNFGFAVENLRIVANRKFVEVNPAASKLFELIKIPIEDINAQNKLVEEGEDSFEDIDRHVDEWIAKNQDVFDSWIEQAIESDYR